MEFVQALDPPQQLLSRFLHQIADHLPLHRSPARLHRDLVR